MRKAADAAVVVDGDAAHEARPRHARLKVRPGVPHKHAEVADGAAEMQPLMRFLPNAARPTTSNWLRSTLDSRPQAAPT